jgi:hypothetical protein
MSKDKVHWSFVLLGEMIPVNKELDELMTDIIPHIIKLVKLYKDVFNVNHGLGLVVVQCSF